MNAETSAATTPADEMPLHPCILGVLRIIGDDSTDHAIDETDAQGMMTQLRQIEDVGELRHALATVLCVAENLHTRGLVSLADGVVHIAAGALGGLEATMAVVLESKDVAAQAKAMTALVGKSDVASGTKIRDQRSAATLSLQRPTWLR